MAPSTAWYGPASASTTQDPREGPSLARRMTPRPPKGSASSGWLPRGGEFNARFTSRGSADVSHDDQGQAGARWAPGGCRAHVSYFVQGRQAIAAESRGINQRFPFWCNETKTPGRQDGGHHRAHRSVTTKGFSQAKTNFVRIDYTTCPLSNHATVESLPAHIWEEDQGHYI